MNLEDRTAVVTGGASGIGRAIAIGLAEVGAAVVVGDIRQTSRVPDERPTTVEVIKDGGGQARFVEADVTEQAAVDQLMETAQTHYGSLDILVNNAGITGAGSVEELDDAQWDRIQEVNVKGVVHGVRAALPYLRDSDHGRIINVASQRGLSGGEAPSKAAYVTSKGAVISLTRQMAIDYGPEGISVNALCPGPIRSGMTPIESDADRERLLEGVLTPFIGEPEDIVPATLLLAGDGARYMHGHALVVDGGYLIN